MEKTYVNENTKLSTEYTYQLKSSSINTNKIHICAILTYFKIQYRKMFIDMSTWAGY